MSIFVPQTSTSLKVPAYFSTKRTGIPAIKPQLIGGETDYCTCLRQCIPCLPAFTDGVGADFYKNDTFLQYINVVTGGTTEYTLIIIDGEGLETEIEVTDNTYGTLVDGIAGTPKFASYNWNFFKIFSVEGFGRYKFKLENKNPSGSKVVQTTTSPVFCLQLFTAKAANRTIRIETEQTGHLQHGNDYGTLPYFQKIRLPGRLKLSSAPMENDDLELNNNNRSLVQIKDQMLPEYELEIFLVSAPQIALVFFDYLFANSVKISDYSVFNLVLDPADMGATQYRSLPLKRISNDFDPSAKHLRKSFTFTMEYFNKNVIKIND